MITTRFSRFLFYLLILLIPTTAYATPIEHKPRESPAQKVFCIGMFKTGTTSVGGALRILGYKSKYYLLKRFSPNDTEAYWNIDDSVGFSHHYDDIKAYAAKFDAFADAPWIYLYREVDKWFPGSKFILTIRDPNELADSDIVMTKRMGNTVYPRDAYIKRYRQHTMNVIEYFKDRPDDLLIYDVQDGWPKLVEFLDVQEPSIPFPHLNKKPD